MSDGTQKTRVNAALRKARENAGLSREDVAEYLGITPTSLYRMEVGTTAVTPDRIERLAEHYQVSIAHLFEDQLVSMPSTIDIDRLQGVVVLIHEIIAKLKAKPSPQKIAEITTQVYQREIERLLNDPDVEPTFDPERHREFVEMVFKK